MNVSRETSSGAVQYAERVWRASSDNRYILWHPERETALRMTEAEAQALVEWLRLAGRLEGITPERFVFGPISDGCVRNFGLEGLPENRHVAARRVGQLMDKVARRTGLGRLHPHQLRHTFAKHLYDATGDIRLVSGLLDHKSIATTQIYVGAMERQKDTYSKQLMLQLGLEL
jgi:integrase